MKKLNIKESFNTKKFKYGGYATLMTFIIVAILIVVNLVSTKLNVKVDLTKNKLFTLSSETYTVLNKTKQDVTIYAFYQTGQEESTIMNILNQYPKHSKHITVKTIDPVKNPAYTVQFSKAGDTIASGTIVVQCGTKFKVLNQSDYLNTDSNSGSVSSIGVEQSITGAIVYATTGKTIKVYNLTGHNETALNTLNPSIASQLKSENFTVSDLNLVPSDAKIEDGSVLLVVSPKVDLSIDEAAKIKTFLKNGGKAVFLMDVVKGSMPNFDDIFKYYGVKADNAIAVEGDSQHAVQYPIYLLPDMQDNDIVNAIKQKNLPIIMPQVRPIETLKNNRSGVKITSLLKSTNNSWAKTNLDTTTVEKESGDLTGPFDLADVITEEVGDNKQTKIVVTGTSYFLNQTIASASKGGNLDFFMSSLNAMGDKNSNISIAPKSLSQDSITINQLQFVVCAVIVVVLIPVVIGGIGVAVWLRRRSQ